MRCLLCLSLFLGVSWSRLRGDRERENRDRNTIEGRLSNSSKPVLPRSVIRWDTTEVPGSLSLLTYTISHHSDSQWYIPSLHDYNSEGRNRSFYKHTEFGDSFACYIKFLGVGLEKYVKGYEMGIEISM
jgi:hypothetical protein